MWFHLRTHAEPGGFRLDAGVWADVLRAARERGGWEPPGKLSDWEQGRAGTPEGRDFSVIPRRQAADLAAALETAAGSRPPADPRDETFFRELAKFLRSGDVGVGRASGEIPDYCT
jgi:hypothetical protein